MAAVPAESLLYQFGCNTTKGLVATKAVWVPPGIFPAEHMCEVAWPLVESLAITIDGGVVAALLIFLRQYLDDLMVAGFPAAVDSFGLFQTSPMLIGPALGATKVAANGLPILGFD